MSATRYGIMMLRLRGRLSPPESARIVTTTASMGGWRDETWTLSAAGEIDILCFDQTKLVASNMIEGTY